MREAYDILERIGKVVAKAYEHGLDRLPMALEMHVKPSVFAQIEKYCHKHFLFGGKSFDAPVQNTLFGIAIIVCDYMDEDFRVVSVVNESTKGRCEK